MNCLAYSLLIISLFHQPQTVNFFIYPSALYSCGIASAEWGLGCPSFQAGNFISVLTIWLLPDSGGDWSACTLSSFLCLANMKKAAISGRTQKWHYDIITLWHQCHNIAVLVVGPWWCYCPTLIGSCFPRSLIKNVLVLLLENFTWNKFEVNVMVLPHAKHVRIF